MSTNQPTAPAKKPAIERYVIPTPKLTKKQRDEAMRNPRIPVLPWKDYGNPRQG